MVLKSKKRLLIVAYWSVVAIAFVCTRLYRLDTIPSGYHWDEAGMAYDAYCLANYGVERHLISFPLYLENYGGGQSVLYAYSCVVLFKIFGVSAWTIRMPAVINSFATILFGFLLAKRINGESITTYLLPVVLLVSPCLITNARVGMDCYLLMGAFTAFTYFFVVAIQNRKTLWFVFAGLVGGVVLYTYALSYIILPVFLLIFISVLMIYKKIKIKDIVAMGIPLFLLALPLIYIQLINIFDLPEMVLMGVTLPQLSSYRVSDFSGFSFANFIFAIKTLVLGDPSMPYVIPQGFSGFYLFTIPFFVIGMASCIAKNIKSIVRKEFNESAFVFTWLLILSVLFCFLLPLAYRMNGFYFPICFFIASGVDDTFGLFVKGWGKKAYIIPTTFFLLSMICFSSFAKYYYFGGYSIENHDTDYFDILVSEGLDYIANDPNLSSKKTQMSGNAVFYNLSMLANPYDSQTIDDDRHLDNELIQCFGLGEIDVNCNYIVKDIYTEYAEELRQEGFKENKYLCYSLFYYED